MAGKYNRNENTCWSLVTVSVLPDTEPLPINATVWWTGACFCAAPSAVWDDHRGLCGASLPVQCLWLFHSDSLHGNLLPKYWLESIPQHHFLMACEQNIYLLVVLRIYFAFFLLIMPYMYATPSSARFANLLNPFCICFWSSGGKKKLCEMLHALSRFMTLFTVKIDTFFNWTMSDAVHTRQRDVIKNWWHSTWWKRITLITTRCDAWQHTIIRIIHLSLSK